VSFRVAMVAAEARSPIVPGEVEVDGQIFFRRKLRLITFLREHFTTQTFPIVAKSICSNIYCVVKSRLNSSTAPGDCVQQ